MPDFSAQLQAALGGEYAIERELGGAGMSRVFVAIEVALARRVVVKVLPTHLASGLSGERFQREIRLAARLQHPLIVPLLAAGEGHGLRWFTMPFIEGESLRDTLARRHRLPAHEVVRILHDVVDALACAHEHGVVHRDIKPGNILASGAHAVVTDFGVAKALTVAVEPRPQGATSEGIAIGTPEYMAPEQLAADPAADHRVDIYAVGLLAYELLTGVRPFAGPSPQDTLAAQLTTVPAPPHRAVRDVPKSLSEVVMRCLEKNAQRRFPTAGALLAALEALPVTTGAAVPPHRDGAGDQSAAPLRGHPRARRRGLVALALVLTGAGVWQLRRRADPPALPPTLSPRDAGPGGALDPSVRLAPTADRPQPDPPDVLVRVDTVVVYRDATDAPPADRRRTVGAASPAGTPGSPMAPRGAPLVITRAESIAIAAAVQARGASPADTARGRVPRGAVAGVAPDAAVAVGGGVARDARRDRDARRAWITEVERTFADSLSGARARHEAALARLPNGLGRDARAAEPRTGAATGAATPPDLSPVMAPPRPGQLRIVVTPYLVRTGDAAVAPMGARAADLLRARLAGVPGVDLVDARTTAALLAIVPDRMALGWSVRADFLLGGVVQVRGDSVVVTTVLTDVRRGERTRVHQGAFLRTTAGAQGGPVAAGAAIAAVLPPADRWVDSVRRRQAGGGGRPMR